MSHPRADTVPPGRPGEPGPHGERPLVLIAEDERPIAETLGDIVDEAGYHAVVATNGRHALQLARQQHPALVITDYMMPYMNGAELVLALRQDAQVHMRLAPPIVIISAAGPLLGDGILAEADAILRKPFDVAEIEALLRRFLGPPPQPLAT